MGVALFGVLLDTLFFPVSPTAAPIVIGITTALALVFLVISLVRSQ